MSILIQNGTILTLNEDDKIIKNGAVFIDGGKIIEVGKTEEVTKKYKPEKIIDAKWKLVMPGFINAHTHMVYGLMRGLGSDLVLLEWLKKFTWPCLANINETDAYLETLLGCIENIKSGTTCAVENYYMAKNRRGNIDKVAEALIESGIRAFIMRGYHDKDTLDIFIESTEEIRREYLRIIRKWHGSANGRIKVWISPVNLLFCTPESIIAMKGLMEEFDIGMHTHVAESKQEVVYIREEYGKGYIEVFNELGVLGPKFHSVHSVWLSDKEIALLSKHNASVIHNPVSNMYLASGIAPISKILESKVRVALGTDASNCSNSQNMIEAMKIAACLQKVNSLDPTALKANQVIRMATIDGAKALGLEKEIGSIEVGKKADIIIIDLKRPHTVPLHDSMATLVYSASAQDVETSIIDGKIVMENRVIKGLNEIEIIEKAQKAAEDLVKRSL
ncbi:MAG: amidohydrolase [Candidatus Bathyarchaeia archaeon]